MIRKTLTMIALAIALATPAVAKDDLLAADPEPGAKDVAAQARRFNRVNDILQRAVTRYQAIIDDLNASGTPISTDPTVQAALQRIVASAIAVNGLQIPSGVAGDTNPADGIIVSIEQNPGALQDPAGDVNVDVQRTLQLVVLSGRDLVNDAAAKLGITPPCATDVAPP